jgi:hypothetical protein
MPCILPEWLKSHVSTSTRPSNRDTRPNPVRNALGGRGVAARIMALVRDVLHVVIIDIPAVASNSRAIVLRVLEPHSECDCDSEDDY